MLTPAHHQRWASPCTGPGCSWDHRAAVREAGYPCWAQCGSLTGSLERGLCLCVDARARGRRVWGELCSGAGSATWPVALQTSLLRTWRFRSRRWAASEHLQFCPGVSALASPACRPWLYRRPQLREGGLLSSFPRGRWLFRGCRGRGGLAGGGGEVSQGLAWPLLQPG